MWEALVVATATTGLFVLAKGFRGNEKFSPNRRSVTVRAEGPGDDLPCPWCYAPTHESDRRCGGCGRSFG
jgi:hypothetical protein